MNNLNFKMKLLERINQTNKSGVSIELLSKEFDVHFYTIQELSNEFKELELIKSIKAGTKDTPNDEILLIKPRGEFVIGKPKELKRLYKTSKMKSSSPTKKWQKRAIMISILLFILSSILGYLMHKNII